MNKIVVLAVFFVTCTLSALAQKVDVPALMKAGSEFDKALLIKDSTVLKKLLHEQVTYGHSNGWVQTKKEVIGDLYNGKITYKKIASGELEVKIEGTVAAVRGTTDVDVEMAGKLISLKLKVLQVWTWRKGNWELFARQSVKM